MSQLGVRWSRDHYTGAARDVAPALLGQYLVYESGQGMLAGRIVETEAYGGFYRRQGDDGSHAFRGRTERNAPMFRSGGWSYIYLIYGMYCCMNVVTGPADEGQAVLIRAIEPVRGMEQMQKNRFSKQKREGVLNIPLTSISNGPGKLCQAFDLDRSCNDWDLCSSSLYIAAPSRKEHFVTGRSCRVNIDYAVKGKYFPWRFYIEGNPFVSKIRSRA